MLIYSTIIILWTFVPCFITSLPQYNQESDNNTNDNNNSSYRYKYTIDDSNKQDHEKNLERRFGESASSQYHANGDQSSTDIKYFLDEWGYHPIVKYRVPNEYAAPDTHLAFDLHKDRVVINNSKINEDGILIESQQTATDKKILPIDNWYENTYGPTSIKDIPEKIDISNNSHNNNNNNNINLELQQYQWVDDQVNQYSTETVVGTEPIADFPSIEELGNSKTSADSNNQDNLNVTDIIKPSTAVDDALLLSENFGKKIYESDTGVGASHIYHVSAETPLKKNDKTISPSIGVSSQNYKNALASFKTQLIKNSQMSMNSNNNKGSKTNTKVLPELSRLTFQNFNDATENLSDIQQTGVTVNPQIIIEPKLNSQEPIVVAETSMTTENYEYSTTFPCNNQEEENKNIKSREETIPPEQRQSSTDERTLYNIVNSPLFVRELSHREDQYTTSPMILNSIQAGLALVNAERTHLIGQNVESSLTNVEPAVHQLENQFELNNRHSSFYITQSDEISIYKNKSLENINSDGFNASTSQSDESIKLSSVPNVTLASINHDNASDKLVEIQKSLELYHSAPIHEIHYPAQLTSQVVTKIDHSPPPDLLYLTTQKHNHQQYNNNQQISDIPHQKDQISYTDIKDLTNSNTDYNYQFISIFDKTSLTTTKTTDQQDKFSNSLNLNNNNNNNNNNFLDIVQQKIVEINDNKNSTVDNLKIPVQNSIVAQINSTRVTRENLTQDTKNVTSLSPDFFDYSSQWNKLNDKSIHSNKETHDIAENVNFKIDSNQWLEPIADRLNYRNNNDNNNNHYRQNNQLNDSKIITTTSSNSNLPPRQIDINFNKEEEKQPQQQYYHSIEDDEIISDATDNSKQTVYLYTPSVIASDYGSIQTNYNSKLPTNRIINREFNSDNVESLSNYPVDKFAEGILDMKAASRPYSVNKDRVLENLQQQKHQKHQKHQQQKHVPVIQDYPVTVQKMLENKVPSPYPIETTTTSTSTSTSTTCIHKLISQPYPIHILEQLPYQVDKVIEMPMRIPTYHPLEIPLRLPLPSSSSSSSSTLSKKLSEKSLNNEPYYGNGIRYGVTYQQIMNPSINGLYPVRFKETNYGELEKLANSSNQNFQGYIYGKQSVIPVVGLRPALSKRYGSLNQLGHAKHQHQNQKQQQQQQQQIINYHPAVISKKQLYNNVLNQLPILIHHPKSVIDQIDLRWHVTHPTEKYKKNKIEYVGPVPLLQPQQVLNLHQNQVPHPAHQESIHYSEPSDTSLSPSFSSTSLSSFFKRVRLPEVHYYGKMGNFRQSKMEYGFKPPMVPSIQYDEDTATKVDNS